MKISSAALKVLSQLSETVGQLSNEEYCLPIPRLGNSTIGQHVRHTLEFFLCLQQGITRGIVNYDDRQRDENIETNPNIALGKIEGIKQFIDSATPEQQLILKVDYAMDENNYQELQTNINRELAYNIEHAIHHMAIIKIGIKEIAPHVNLPHGFGIAVSTLRYRKEQLPQT